MTESVVFAINMAQHGPRSVDEQLAHVTVAALADPQQTIPASGAVLPGRQPKRGSEVSSSAERLTVSQGT